MKSTGRAVLSTTMFASSALGIYILTTDNFLRFAAPTHYEGLAVFVLIDTILIAALWKQIQYATLGAMLSAAVQLAAMLGDVVAGQPAGVPAAAFASYLLSDTAFVSLLTIQGIIIALTTGTRALPLMQKLTLHRIGKS